MEEKAHFTHKTLGVVILILFTAMMCMNCDEKEKPGPHGDIQPSHLEPKPAEPQSDLTISTIEVFPVQPQSGVQFALNIYVKNEGQAASGVYDLAIYIKDVSRNSTYPVGTFRKDKLQPGENVVAYSSTDRFVNDPGSYQVHVEIKPFLFEDSNMGNNIAIWAFTVR